MPEAIGSNSEFEIKFQVEAAEAEAVQADVGRGDSRQERLRALYYDTPDGALAAARIVLRVRKEGAHWVQTAKAPGKGALHRLEHNVPLPPGRTAPRPELMRHAGTPIGTLIERALKSSAATVEAIELVSLYSTDIRRISRQIQIGDATVELAFDRGEIRASGKRRAVCELELELKEGDPRSLLELAERWRARHRLWINSISKSARGERLARGVTFGPAIKAQARRLEVPKSKRDGSSVFCAMLESCLAQILPNASDIAAGSTDPDQIHQLRVGIRRLRTGLREMKPLAPGQDPGWEPALVEVFRSLGRLRDRDNLVQKIQPRVSHAGGPELTGLEQHERPSASASEIVCGSAFQQVLIQVIEAALPDPAASSLPEKAVAAWLVKRLSKLHRQVVRDGRRFEELEPDAQHRVRKRLKRLRYLGEFVAPIFDRNAKRYLKALGPAQDALGAHNDEVAALATYREVALRDGRAWFAVGWLTARQADSAHACRVALAGLAKAKPFWKAARK
ncbi:Inorganic triphosphatase YgiF, contains CYTH and CHAD domains [Burkholderiales bacterium 8X]|nr:Inorganic triphosphatase YgiF, contains CYTH and CHAD domains [Burkholderiales bacterium 8X]